MSWDENPSAIQIDKLAILPNQSSCLHSVVVRERGHAWVGEFAQNDLDVHEATIRHEPLTNRDYNPQPRSFVLHGPSAGP